MKIVCVIYLQGMRMYSVQSVREQSNFKEISAPIRRLRLHEEKTFFVVVVVVVISLAVKSQRC